jgi:hypothetical protein
LWRPIPSLSRQREQSFGLAACEPFGDPLLHRTSVAVSVRLPTASFSSGTDSMATIRPDSLTANWMPMGSPSSGVPDLEIAVVFPNSENGGAPQAPRAVWALIIVDFEI